MHKTKVVKNIFVLTRKYYTSSEEKTRDLSELVT